MLWLIKLFVRQHVRDFVQNYIDGPSNWKIDKTRLLFTNIRHHLSIEFNSGYHGVYQFNAGSLMPHRDYLRWAEKYYLVNAFRSSLEGESYIPTKATHPEEFI